ncbi:Transposon Tf2-6 polyprotein [Smittium mucronatum]|uniref:Transposon Tf2-6 polyprotein n=1 Tax=Smittium mucronatum TaxID=133383 RepID=A0A1R0GM01_9FUNG|nr:Transposon Tf2-6 polyprotein [Smittium mucronatum]
MIDYLNNNASANIDSDNQSKQYKIINNALYKISNTNNPRLYVPKSLVTAILFHHDKSNMSYLGHMRTLEKTCKTCQLTKNSTRQTPGELQPIIVSEPFEMVSIDFVGPLRETESGKNPVKLLSDNGAAFTSQLMNTLCTNYGIKQVFSSPYHPETNVMTEMFNKTLKVIIIAYKIEDQPKWDEHLEMYFCAYRTAKHENLGLSPFEALFVSKPKFPASNLKPASPNVPLSVIAY